MVGTNHGGQWCFAFFNGGLRGYFLPRRERNQTGLPVLTSGIERSRVDTIYVPASTTAWCSCTTRRVACEACEASERGAGDEDKHFGKAVQRWRRTRAECSTGIFTTGAVRAKPTPAVLLKSINRGPVKCRTARTFVCNGSNQNTDEISRRHSRRRGDYRGRPPACPSCSCRLHAAGDRRIGACCPRCRVDGGRSDSAQTPRLNGRDRSMLPLRA